MKKIYIDGQAGTTGLRIRERLAERDDVTVLTLPEDKRKDTEARRERGRYPHRKSRRPRAGYLHRPQNQPRLGLRLPRAG